MTDGQRSFMAFALIAIVLVMTPRYLKWLSPQSASPSSGADTTFVLSPLIPAEDENVPAVFRAQPQIPAPVKTTLNEREWEVITPLYRAVISSRGGGSIAEFELYGHASGRQEGNVQLISQRPHPPTLQISYINLDGDSVYLDGNWEVLGAPGLNHIELQAGDEQTFSFRERLASGAEVTRKITLTGDGFVIPLQIQWLRPDRELGINVFEIQWPVGLLPAERLLREDETYGKVHVFQGGELASQGAVRNGAVDRKTLKGTTAWVAIRNKYFATALIADPAQLGDYGAYSAQALPADEVGLPLEKATRFSMALGYTAQPRTNLLVYLGPLAYDRIKSLDVELQRIMNFGFALIRPISKAILWTLVSLYEYIPNYGVVLILFAVFVRVLTNPLTRKSAISTQKMQLIQPRVQELQAKYKGNPQKLNKEMMALWKSEGVNPLGGCLPILIQLPLLWAFFIVFRTTIELRGQPFIFWVKDLSVPDVIFYLPFKIPLYGDGVTVLALIMGITMFVQQKLSGASSNPQQKPMMYMMTGMFFLLFNQFPSGLNLYYAFSNFLAILQQRNIRKSLQAGGSAPVTAPIQPAKIQTKRPVKRKKRR